MKNGIFKNYEIELRAETDKKIKWLEFYLVEALSVWRSSTLTFQQDNQEIYNTLTELQHIIVEYYSMDIFDADVLDTSFENFKNCVHWTLHLNYISETACDEIEVMTDTFSRCNEILTSMYYPNKFLIVQEIEKTFKTFEKKVESFLEATLLSRSSGDIFEPIYLLQADEHQGLYHNFLELKKEVNNFNTTVETVIVPMNEFFEILDIVMGMVGVNHSLPNLTPVLKNEVKKFSEIAVSYNDWPLLLQGIGIQVSMNFLEEAQEGNTIYSIMKNSFCVTIREAELKTRFLKLAENLVNPVALKLTLFRNEVA